MTTDDGTLSPEELHDDEILGEASLDPSGSTLIEAIHHRPTHHHHAEKEKVIDSGIVTPVETPVKLDWDGPDDPANPRNWSIGKKWASVGVASLYTFVAPLGSSMVAPALPDLAVGYDVSNPTVIALCVAIYVLAFAVGPLFLAPLSELYGRRWVLHVSNLVFLAFILGCAWAPGIGSFIICRFLAGLGGSAPLAIGGGVVADVFDPRQRASAMALYSLGPVFGPAIGPVAGGFIVQSLGFRWVSWILAMLAGAGAVIGIPLLQETYAPIILARRATRRDTEQGFPPGHSFPEPLNAADKRALLMQSMGRPIALLCTNFICFILSLFMALQYGFLYLMFVTFPDLYAEVYGWSTGVSGLAYLGPGMGFVVATACVAPVMDKLYAKLSERNNGVGLPEFRIPVVMIGALLGPIGLFWYGWSAEEHAQWILPIIGSGIFSCGMMLTFVPLQVYLIDTFQYGASALAAATVFRSLLGFAFPLFGEQMFAALGTGGGNSLLAGLAMVIGIPFPIWLWFNGAAIRARGKL